MTLFLSQGDWNSWAFCWGAKGGTWNHISRFIPPSYRDEARGSFDLGTQAEDYQEDEVRDEGYDVIGDDR